MVFIRANRGDKKLGRHLIFSFKTKGNVLASTTGEDDAENRKERDLWLVLFARALRFASNLEVHFDPVRIWCAIVRHDPCECYNTGSGKLFTRYLNKRGEHETTRRNGFGFDDAAGSGNAGANGPRNETDSS